MQAVVPVSFLLWLLGGLIAAAALAYFVYRLWRLERSIAANGMTLDALLTAIREADKSTQILYTEIKGFRDLLAPAAESMRSNMEGVPKLLEGLTKIASAQLDLIQFKQSVEKRPENPFLPTSRSPLAPRDVTSANQEYEIDQIIRAEGVSREEALMRMNPANQASVWDGGNIFGGWKE
jgi:hypothetical protein